MYTHTTMVSGRLRHKDTPTPSPSAHPAHSPGVGDEHTSTSRRPPTPHRHSFARSSSNRLRSSIPHAIEEIPDFFRPPTAPAEGKNPLIYLIAEHGLCSSLGTCKCHLRYMMRSVGRQPSDETFKKKSEQMSTNRKSEVGGSGTGISLHSARSISARQHGDTLEKKLQRRPTQKEMFRHLHTHGHDGQTFVDQRSAKIDAELTRRLEEMSTQTPDTSIDEDAVYLEGKQDHLEDQRMDLMSWKSSKWDHQRLQETFFEGANGKTRRNAERLDGMPRRKSRDAGPVCAPVAFDIGVAYREGVDKASLFLLAPEAMIRTLEVLYAREVLDEDAKLTSPIGFQVSKIPLDLDGKRSPS
ncbi:hypothetical protein Scep_026373 [Stephania cephalantha]|uniref:Uncharacterized protein n=1 Tax=Stephania cephalantha TaxID=152367 RepID=A0AAP0HQB8_9MAGN